MADQFIPFETDRNQTIRNYYSVTKDYSDYTARTYLTTEPTPFVNYNEAVQATNKAGPVLRATSAYQALGAVTLEQFATAISNPDWNQERQDGLDAIAAESQNIGAQIDAEFKAGLILVTTDSSLNLQYTITDRDGDLRTKQSFSRALQHRDDPDTNQTVVENTLAAPAPPPP